MTSQSAAQRNVSLVFQSYALFPHMSVMENVCYGLTVQKMKNRMPRPAPTRPSAAQT